MKSLLLNILLLCGITTLAKEYHVIYFTSDNQNLEYDATLKIKPVNGDTVNIVLRDVNNVEIVNVNGVLFSDDIKLINNADVSGGYLYKHFGKLRGNIFMNVGDERMLFIIIRER